MSRRACSLEQQVIAVRTQGAQGELAYSLGIEKGIGPGEFAVLLVEQSIGGDTGRRRVAQE